MEYDCSGWATKNNILCSDGRTIMKDAFKQNDGQKVPLVWNHQHNDPNEVLGHAVLENREEGVYAYCKFNTTESGQTAKALVHNGDVNQLSIYANKLKSQKNNVIHGCIREVSLVLAGANPGAFIDSVVMHGEGADAEEEVIIYTDENIDLVVHSDEQAEDEENKEETVVHADSDDKSNKEDGQMDDKEKQADNKEKTIAEVIDTMNEEQKTAMYALVGQAVEDAKKGEFDNEGEDEEMKQNVFDNDMQNQDTVLSHSDAMAIIELAKKPNVGSLKHAMELYLEDTDVLQHGFSDETITQLFPEYELLKKGAPERVDGDFAWVDRVLNRAHKSPISRVRTRYVDSRQIGESIKAMGYTKREEKELMAQLPLLGRSHDPQTIYVKEELERDDIIDITDFDIVAYQKSIMEDTLKRTLALAILIGDGREDGVKGKIKEAHVASIWNDKELYTIHRDVDIEAAKTELQGTDTNAHFSTNYIYAEAIIRDSLYAREKYKGSGSLDFYCTPHLLNVMLLARDLNGRRIYNSKADLAQALNVNEIHTIEQFEGKTRKTEDGKTKKLLGLYVNMNDYQIGCTKGGQITNFEDFDIDFNQYKYLMETRLSGALTRPFAAIALEEPVTEEAAG